MVVSSHRHAPALLRLYPVNMRTVGWAPRPVSTLWRREKFLAPAGIITSDFPACSLVTIPAILTEMTHFNIIFQI